MTGDSLTYKYINKNAPKEKVDYSYSAFNGEIFLNSWKTSRSKFLKIGELSSLEFASIEDCATKKMFLDWVESFNNNAFVDFEKLHLLIKRFEVTRKIYESYDLNFRPMSKNTSYSNIDLYVVFSYVLVGAYKNSKKLYYLNSLLKVNDIILGNEEVINDELQYLFSHCIHQEVDFVQNIRKELL